MKVSRGITTASLGLSVGLLGLQAKAQVVEFDGLRPEWQTAVGPHTTIDFTDLAHGTFVFEQYANLGVHFVDGNDQVIYSPEGFLVDGVGIRGWDETRLEFDDPTYAIATDFAGGVQFELFWQGSSIYQSSRFAGSGYGRYAGLLSAQPFDEVVIVDPWDLRVYVDDIHFSTSIVDCNRNGVPDLFDLMQGTSEDCNRNGVPDECDIDSGSSDDCNANGIPDDCEAASIVGGASEQLSPFGLGNAGQYTYPDPRTALSDVTLHITAHADLDELSEWVEIDLNGTTVAVLVFWQTGSLCADPPDEEEVTIPAEVFNDAIAGGTDAVFTARTGSSVNPWECSDDSYITMAVSYLGAGYNDLNHNGVPDDCECPADVNSDGVVNVSDLLAVLDAWGPCPPPDSCPEDINGDGVVNVSDLLELLSNWGPCP